MGRSGCKQCCRDVPSIPSCSETSIRYSYKTDADWLSKAEYIDYLVEVGTTGGFDNLTKIKSSIKKANFGDFATTLSPAYYLAVNKDLDDDRYLYSSF